MNTNHGCGPELRSGVFAAPDNGASGCSAPGLSAAAITRALGMLCLLWAALLAGLGLAGVWAGNEPERITIDYPLDGSVFPPDMAAPTFLWRDPAPNADSWQIDVSFAYGAPGVHMSSKVERM